MLFCYLLSLYIHMLLMGGSNILRDGKVAPWPSGIIHVFIARVWDVYGHVCLCGYQWCGNWCWGLPRLLHLMYWDPELAWWLVSIASLLWKSRLCLLNAGTKRLPAMLATHSCIHIPVLTLHCRQFSWWDLSPALAFSFKICLKELERCSSVKSPCCFCKEFGFSSQYLHGGSQPSIALNSKALRLSSDFSQHQALTICIYISSGKRS